MKREQLKIPLNKSLRAPGGMDSQWWESQAYINGYHAGLQGATRKPTQVQTSKEMWLRGYDDARGNLELIKDDV